MTFRIDDQPNFRKDVNYGRRERNKLLAATRRKHAESYIMISLVAFAVTVIVTRVFLELTGYPQIGNSVLHIAHALWGGLFMIVAAYLPLVYVTRWVIQLSAILGGVGVGLFIDEIGKFITQANDYFFPPAMPLIYGFILLIVLVYFYFRRSRQTHPRQAMSYVLQGLQDALDGNLDTEDAVMLEAHLATARQSDREDIASLADAVNSYLEKEKIHLPTAEPGIWKRITHAVSSFGQRLGRSTHRKIISGLLLLWLVIVIGYIAILVQGSPTIDILVLQWRNILIGIKGVIGSLMVIAILAWFSEKEELGLNFAAGGFLLSLVALQTLYFYISQFSAINATLLQLAFLQILFAYRRWYLRD